MMIRQGSTLIYKRKKKHQKVGIEKLTDNPIAIRE